MHRNIKSQAHSLNTYLDRPSITVMMPFEPKMMPKKEISDALETVIEKVETILNSNYPPDSIALLLHKLHTIFSNLNFNTHKKSLAICLSPVFERVFYFDIPMQENMIVEEGFHIRDLVKNKKVSQEFLVLILSGNESKVLVGKEGVLTKIVGNDSKSVYAVAGHSHEQTGHCSNGENYKETVLQKFLRYVDRNLSIVLQAYRLPVFVAGTHRVAGHFRAITKHQPNIVGYIHGNYDKASPEDWIAVMKPYLEKWEEVVSHDLQNQLNDAANHHQLAVGIRDVWKESMIRKGRLLVVENDFMNGPQKESNSKTIYMPGKRYEKFGCIQNAVDEIIASVLENGGDVKFADKAMMNAYNHIALIKYY